MHLEPRNNDVWIVGAQWGDCGPYATQAEAKEDMRGLERFLRYQHDPEYILGEDDAKTWRKQMKEQLTALDTATGHLYKELVGKRLDARDAGTNLIVVLDQLRGIPVYTKSADQWHLAIKLAKEACEELQKRTGEAYRCGDQEFGNFLKDRINDFSPLVARLLPLLDKTAKEPANEASA